MFFYKKRPGGVCAAAGDRGAGRLGRTGARKAGRAPAARGAAMHQNAFMQPYCAHIFRNRRKDHLAGYITISPLSVFIMRNICT